MPEPLSTERLAEIEARLKALDSPLPWKAWQTWGVTVADAEGQCLWNSEFCSLNAGDAVLIAAAPTDLAALLGEVRRLRMVEAGWQELAMQAALSDFKPGDF